MGLFTPHIPKRRLKAEGRQTLESQLELAPDIFAAESIYGPAYQSLQQEMLWNQLFGGPERTLSYDSNIGGKKPQTTELTIPGSRGLLAMLQQIRPEIDALELASQSRYREADIGDLESMGPRAAMAAMATRRASDPELASLLDELKMQALSELKLGADLDPSLEREISQAVRGGQAARGLGFGPVDIFQEAYTRGSAGERLRGMRRGFAQNVVNQAGAYAPDPFSFLLRRPNASQLTSGITSMGMGRGGPSMFDPWNAYAADVYGSNQSAKADQEIARANFMASLFNEAAESFNPSRIIGNLGGSGGGGGGGGMGGIMSMIGG